MRLALIGMPGCGKSTVGRHLARHLGLRFVDSDLEIERATGMPIRDLFERDGETTFRDLEQTTLEVLSQQENILLATGGGAVLRTSNRETLHSSCHVVYLRATPEELFRRVRHDTKRPLLKVDDPQQRLRDLFAERDPLYRRTAHIVVEAMRPSVSALTSSIITQLEANGMTEPGSFQNWAPAARDDGTPEHDG